MTDITINELQEKRKQLEREIASYAQEKLNRFAEEFGVSVDGVSVSRGIEVTQIGSKVRTFIYEASIDLDI